MSEPKTRRPRRPKLCEINQAAICRAVALGASQRIAARAGGIALTTLQEWLTRGRDGDARYTGFLKAYEEAQTKADVGALAAIAAAAKKDWRAAAWSLQRRHPDDYGERVTQEILTPEIDPLALADRLLGGLKGRGEG